MHRLIAGNPSGILVNVEVDHKNGDKIDNRRINLRLVTQREGRYNRPKYKNNKSGYKGVYWYKPTKRWQAQIVVDKKLKSLGYYHDKIEAAKAYNAAVIKHQGEHARLNEIGTTNA